MNIKINPELRIKYRGRDKYNRWVYGTPHFDLNRQIWHIHDIMNCGRIADIPDETTISQFTGLKKKSEIEIYPGDVLMYFTSKELKGQYKRNFYKYEVKHDPLFPCDGMWLAGIYHFSPKMDISQIENMIYVGNIHEHKRINKED